MPQDEKPSAEPRPPFDLEFENLLRKVRGEPPLPVEEPKPQPKSAAPPQSEIPTKQAQQPAETRKLTLNPAPSTGPSPSKKTYLVCAHLYWTVKAPSMQQACRVAHDVLDLEAKPFGQIVGEDKDEKGERVLRIALHNESGREVRASTEEAGYFGPTRGEPDTTSYVVTLRRFWLRQAGSRTEAERTVCAEVQHWRVETTGEVVRDYLDPNTGQKRLEILQYSTPGKRVTLARPTSQSGCQMGVKRAESNQKPSAAPRPPFDLAFENKLRKVQGLPPLPAVPLSEDMVLARAKELAAKPGKGPWEHLGPISRNELMAAARRSLQATSSEPQIVAEPPLPVEEPKPQHRSAAPPQNEIPADQTQPSPAEPSAKREEKPRVEREDAPVRDRQSWVARTAATMNIAQKIAALVTLLTVAVFLFAGGAKETKLRYDPRYGPHTPYECTDWAQTAADIVGITIVGGVAVLLLGIRRKRAKNEQKPAA